MNRKDRTTAENTQNRLLGKTAKCALERRDANLDEDTLAQLGRMRRNAVTSAAASNHGPLTVWLPLSGAMAACLIAVLLWPQTRIPVTGDEAIAVEMWLMEEGVELELLEDVEFYQWLAEGVLSEVSS